jgi:hypothetical protein
MHTDTNTSRPRLLGRLVPVAALVTVVAGLAVGPAGAAAFSPWGSPQCPSSYMCSGQNT